MGQTTSTTIRTETQARADIYQRVTDSIVAAIEAEAGKWRMPWHTGADGIAPVLPVNVATGRPYRGVNTIVLWAQAQASTYGSAVWGTYRQWPERGAQVRKGEQASPVVFWKIIEAGEPSDGGEEQDDDQGSRRFFARATACSTRPRWTATKPPPLPCCRRRSASSGPRRSLPG